MPHLAMNRWWRWRWSLFLFLIWASTGQAQGKGQRVRQLPWGATPEMKACCAQCTEPVPRAPDCPSSLLPWGLLVVLLAVQAAYFLYFRGQGDEGELEIQAEEAFLRDMLGVLRIIRNRLWDIIETERRLQHQQQNRHR